MLSEGWGLPLATSGDFSWPPAGTSSGHQWGLSHGHGHQGDQANNHAVDDAIAENLSFTGRLGAIEIRNSHLVTPVFLGRTENLRLVVSSGIVTFPRGEPFSLEVGERSSVLGLSLGGDDQGLVLSSLKVDGGAKTIEAINLFRLDPVFLPQLSNAQRVSAWWPSRRRAILDARTIECGMPLANHHPAARAHHWASVEKLLIDKSAPGANVAIAHEVAQDAQRRAAGWHSAERWLLELNRVMGYCTRLLRPLGIWAVTAAAFALVIHIVAASNPCFLDCDVDDISSGLELYWDVLVSPVSFVRPISEDSLLGKVIANDLPSKVLAFVGRAIGTWCVIAATLAVRRYVRSS